MNWKLWAVVVFILSFLTGCSTMIETGAVRGELTVGGAQKKVTPAGAEIGSTTSAEDPAPIAFIESSTPGLKFRAGFNAGPLGKAIGDAVAWVKNGVAALVPGG